MDIDVTTLTNDDLKQLRVDVLTEQERRANQARIPEQIADLSRTYQDGGGDVAVLEQAIVDDKEEKQWI